MSQTISVDPDVFPAIAAYYESQCTDLVAIKSFVVANCTLDDAFGVLLSIMKPQYEEARDKTMSAMDSVNAMLVDLAGKVEDYADAIEIDENNHEQRITDLEGRVSDLEGQLAAGSGAGQPGGGGSSFGGGGGSGGGQGSYTGGSGDVTGGVDPGDDTTNDGDDDGDTNITINVEGDNNTVTVGEDGTVGVEPNDDTEAPATDEPVAETPATEAPVAETPVTEAPVAETPGAGTPVAETPVVDPEVAVLDPEVVAAENAAQAKFYEELWQEQAANDPLGRTADELRLAWENRESIELTLSTENVVGYATPTVEPIPVDFGVFAAANVKPTPLIGASA